MSPKTEHDPPSMGIAQKLANVRQAYSSHKGHSVAVSMVNLDGVDIVLGRGDGITGVTVNVEREKTYADDHQYINLNREQEKDWN